VGISGEGNEAERRFRQLTGAKEADKNSDGDAVVDGVPVEVKKASTSTLNQVRAVKYIPLVVLDVRTDAWYVVPAHEIVRLVLPKARGQHNEIAFECSTLSITMLARFRVNDEKKLLGAVRTAISSAAKYPKLKAEMDRTLTAAKSLASETRNRVEALFREIDREA
jgi:hypothetical protein